MKAKTNKPRSLVVWLASLIVISQGYATQATNKHVKKILPKKILTQKNDRSFPWWSKPEASFSIQARQDNDICSKEISTFNARIPRIVSSMQKFTGKLLEIENIPSIGIACSGGSFRAAIATLGLLRGLQAIGLLDAVAYLASLSGSTWTAAAWLTHDNNLNDLTTFLRNKLQGGLSISNVDEDAIFDAVFDKFKQTYSFSANDIWGGLIADVFLRTDTLDAQTVKLSNLQDKVLSGDYPLPLFTAVIGETNPDYQWAEFSPFEAGSTYLSAWIPSTAFGKKFTNGASSDKSPEETLSFLMGLWGSAYAANFLDIIQAIKETVETEYEFSLPTSCFSWITWGNDIRISPPEVYNFAYKIPNSPLANEQNLTFIDGGFAFNFPFPPLLRRNVELYIVCDATEDGHSEIGNDMREVEAYAKKNNYPFPPIDYKKLTQQKLSVHTDENNPQAPIIIVVPNFEKFSSLKFSYTAQEFDKVMDGIENAIVANAETIKHAVMQAINNKQTRGKIMAENKQKGKTARA